MTQYSKRPSDINQHLTYLWSLAKGCRHITEFGVREVVSTWALMAALPNRLVSYDIVRHGNVGLAEQVALREGVDFKFIQGSTLDVVIEPTELLFIDTLHTFNQMQKELELHSGKVSKYIVLHDTETFGVTGEDGGIGIFPAIGQFLSCHPEWRIHSRHTHNNGLTVLAKQQQTSNSGTSL